MEEKLDSEKLASDIFNLLLKETENNKAFRDALRNFIEAIEKREDEWLSRNIEN